MKTIRPEAAALLSVLALGALAGCQPNGAPAAVDSLGAEAGEAAAALPAADGGPAPELAEAFQNAFREGDLYVAGKPQSAESFVAAKALGVKTVVDILTEDEHPSKVPFDEAGTLEGLGIRYVRIPVSPATFSAADVAAFGEAMEGREGKVLLHCASANRAGGLYAAWLHQQGLDLDASIERAKAVGLRSESMVEAVRRVGASD